MFNEKLICDSSNTDLEIKNLINASQYGIMESRSCQTKLIAFFARLQVCLIKATVLTQFTWISPRHLTQYCMIKKLTLHWISRCELGGLEIGSVTGLKVWLLIGRHQ